MHAAGFTNTVALCGVAFTAGHLRLLAGYTQRIVLLLDADRAGEASMEKIVAMLSCGTDPEGGAVGAGLFVRSEPDAASLRGGPGQPAAWIGLRLFPPSDHRFPPFGFAGNLRTPPASADCKDRERFISLSFM